MRLFAIAALLAGCGDDIEPVLCPRASSAGAEPVPLAQAKYVAHAFGSPEGLQQIEHYTESREAFEISYRNGFRAFEIDLMQLADGTVAAVHDNNEKEYALDKPFLETTRDELSTKKWRGEYPVLFGEDLVEIVASHPDMWLILDTKCCHENIARALIALAPDDSVRDRIVPHVTGEEHANALPGVYPFKEQMYARYWWGGTDDEVLARLAQHHISNVMMWWDANWNEDFQERADAAGLHVWVHTPHEPADIERFQARGVGTYTDGYLTCGEH